jgi:hypothetical protein
MVKFTIIGSFTCGPTVTSSFRDRNPELKKNSRTNRGTETDNKEKKCGEQEGEDKVRVC